MALARAAYAANVTESGGRPWDVPSDVYQDAEHIIDFAIQGDRAKVVDTLDAVVDRGGVRGAYELACCLAATMVGDSIVAGFAALDFPEIDDVAYDARWVARFVSAYANADAPTGEALFGAAMADGQLSACLISLAGSTGATLRRRGGEA
jgi:hypothetical protein